MVQYNMLSFVFIVQNVIYLLWSSTFWSADIHTVFMVDVLYILLGMCTVSKVLYGISIIKLILVSY